MIFVTVGTHEQPFNRLIKTVDDLKGKGVIDEPVFIQTGYSTYEPKYCDWKSLLSYNEMQQKVDEAHIVISHGGPSSFLMPLKEGKVPIVVPRKAEFNEHINNHQVDFIEAVTRRFNNIIPIYDIKDIGPAIQNYDQITQSIRVSTTSNNALFNERLEMLVKNLLQ
ncbi:glycosyltransferase [Bifidobacterium felsineum]|uniref:glycosyltransferase n=1 Tax=Bifidobacterium felsineum TaxID=2045440 RepID=UPI001BDD3B16|nr:glycosyltransferase [Bifidobacterium felsineum]MBT1165160.1 hypothetical protein [Bifidobacterium felsineum]